MTPAEHYNEANALIARVKARREKLGRDGAMELIALAQVHATLANAPLEQIEVIQR